jgi:DNA-nicking Smr family endonuclease
VRSLSPEEAALWARVAATIRPLSRDLKDREAPENDPPPTPVASKVMAVTPRRPPIRPAPTMRVGTTLDGNWDKRIKSGQLTPDRTLDLHGHSLERAWWALDDALERSVASGDRVLLLITGHQRRGEPPIERGRIRAAIHDWLAASRHASRIASVRGAHRRHGGGGSLYIILRKA